MSDANGTTTAVTVKWCKDQKVENHLRQLGIKFETETVKFSEIDLQASADRQVRIAKKIEEKWVLEFALSMEAGDVFPMPVLNREKKNRYTVLSGNHRTHAVDTLGVDSIDAYIVQVFDPRQIDIFTRSVNAKEGHRLTLEECCMQAAYLVEHHSLDTEDAARLLGVKYDTLSAFMRGSDVALKISQAGGSPEGISKSMLIKMAPLRNDANILREVTKLIGGKRLSTDECIQLLDDVKGANTENQRRGKIGEWEAIAMHRAATSTALPSTVRQTVRPKFFSKLTAFAKFIAKYNTLEQLQVIEPSDLARAKKEYAVIERQMHKILNGKAGG